MQIEELLIESAFGKEPECLKATIAQKNKETHGNQVRIKISLTTEVLENRKQERTEQEA